MSEPHSEDVISSLPHSRPYRRSGKRPARPSQPAQDTPAADRTHPADDTPAAQAQSVSRLPAAAQTIGTVVQALAELTEIAAGAGIRALRRAVSNLPRPSR